MTGFCAIKPVAKKHLSARHTAISFSAIAPQRQCQPVQPNSRNQAAAASLSRRRCFEFRARRSFFRSESKAPKTPLSHGFRGLAAIKPVADSGPTRGFGFGFGFWFLVFGFWFLVFGFWFLAFGFWFLAATRLLALPVAFTALMTRPRNPPAPVATLWVWHPALFFQEQIQAPKNAPIARFDGLGCYQSRSGLAGGIGG